MPAARPQIHRGRSRTTGSGFTLVEVIAVMAIAGILAVVALPTMGSLSTSRAAGAQRQLRRDLGYARERALTTGSRTWVSFSAASNGYSVLVEPAGGSGRVDAVLLSDPATGRTFEVRWSDGAAGGAALSAASFDGGTDVGFDWRGRPLGAAGADLIAPGIVTMSDGRTVTVAPGSGLASIP